jgi:hypothetical protein
MIDRTSLTKIFLSQWGKSTDDANLKFYSRQWWHSNRSSNNSYRLSGEGLDFLVNTLGLKAYKIPFTEPIDKSPQTVIYLSRFIDCPYFLTNQSITVFSEIKSFELHLFSDDIRKYGIIKSLNERQRSLQK